ncbi:RNA polymerase sigma-70 factor [Puteibacter caeruleilacunae]|nr:RNA polymerase sigma-70 factor [Puteibacter caeruleilacunae]
MNVQERKLLNALKQRDLKAYEELFFKYHGRLVLFANKFTGDMQIAKDIVQDAFLTLWDKADHLTINESVKSYLFQSIRNGCLNYNRHLQIRDAAHKDIGTVALQADRELFFQSDDPYMSLLEKEMEQKIAEVIERMPEKCRVVFKMSRQEYKKNKEIAQELGISVKMVEKHISKALSILRQDLSDYMVVVLTLLLKNL